ncbi:hypothetical protein HYDPIDRAFT_33444 [Hydnomerulius pinastri MD-312]|uniref:Uncharacterized protein n=1 Tax=Hydnomerulius pinastri MD-312 TaxID=994086 RepID=A0A0C9VNC3_9AGAM|nr:hypothetical protein HYDPIDRAFT_33444 [Hydnomerulius pinastri MD-312]
MNALAVKTQIRDRLRQRKFELERIERAYRQTIGDQRLRSHAEASVKRWEPTLLRLVTTYNRLCDKLSALIRQRRAMQGAIVPHYIPREGLFELDVDDDIWQDVGLVDDEVDPPAWLADDRVRAGIRDLLERDRCEEEEAVVRARDIHLERGDMDMVYQLELRQEELEGLPSGWWAMVRGIPPAWSMSESWGGPSVGSTCPCIQRPRSPEGAQVTEDDNDNWESEVEDEREDDELLEALEDWGLAEEYRFDAQPEGGVWEGGVMDDEDLYGDEEDFDIFPSSPIRR